MKSKEEINKEAEFHLLSNNDSFALKYFYNSLKNCIKNIIKQDNLPEGNWVPSEDFKCLIRKD